jgi:hypothetical protein
MPFGFGLIAQPAFRSRSDDSDALQANGSVLREKSWADSGEIAGREPWSRHRMRSMRSTSGWR